VRAGERDDEQSSEIATDFLPEAIVRRRSVVRDGCAMHEKELYSPMGMRRESGHWELP
jgi:hypothetical protein